MRKSEFPYTTRKDGSKQYKSKTLELKIEAYDHKDHPSSFGQRKGKISLNIAEFINRGLCTETFNLDTKKNSDNYYLTVKISLVPAG